MSSIIVFFLLDLGVDQKVSDVFHVDGKWLLTGLSVGPVVQDFNGARHVSTDWQISYYFKNVVKCIVLGFRL